ncbi:MAG: type II toxin-antitoxin system RelE/ParE family toxin [Lentisphaerae bacterium]|jgi:plasmid stabilization system protein ParE|nr:type II toxin-antitoxin system RelE/ParE family toxin [Lentisphaerota bacterium]
MRMLYVPEIARELADARDWYESRSDGLGEEFIRMAYAAFDELQEYPEKYEVVYAPFRRALLRRFPYSIYYHYAPDTITVYGVFHSSRDPQRVLQMLGTR